MMTRLEQWITALVLNVVIIGLFGVILYEVGNENITSNIFLILLICLIVGTPLIKVALYLTEE